MLNFMIYSLLFSFELAIDFIAINSTDLRKTVIVIISDFFI